VPSLPETAPRGQLTLAPRDHLATLLRVALTLINSTCPALAEVQVRSSRRHRERRLLPHEVRAAAALDEAARLLAIAADLDLQGLEEFSGPLVRRASWLLDEAYRRLTA
jgi:hypothetical protein